MEMETRRRLPSSCDRRPKPPFPYSPTAPMDSNSPHSPTINSTSEMPQPSAVYSTVTAEHSPTNGGGGGGRKRAIPTDRVNGTELPISPSSSPRFSEFEKSERTAAVKVQKVYRSYRTRRRLADTAVVAEELWWQAIDFARLNHSTVSFFNFQKAESAASRWNRVSLNASKVGKGLSKDAKAQKLAFQHWIEAIDPRHRYGHWLHKYYEVWSKADSGQPFFYWLDVGDGKEVDLKEYPRSKLRQQCITYLGPKERENYEYIVVEGKIIHKQTGDPLDTNKGPRRVKWIFVMSTNKKIYASEKKKGVFQHSSFLAGGATLAAGRLVADNGMLKSVSPYSGHYRPTEDSLDSFLSFLKENGVDIDEVQISNVKDDYDDYENGKWLDVPTESEATHAESVKEKQNPQCSEPAKAAKPVEVAPIKTTSGYRRTLSGGLQSPRAEVSKTAILQRINSKKAASSYQLGHQLSLKWSTGAGPRIGCVADYPKEVRVQALEFVNLSPKSQFTPSGSSRWLDGLASLTASSPTARSSKGAMAAGQTATGRSLLSPRTPPAICNTNGNVAADLASSTAHSAVESSNVNGDATN